MKKIRIGLLAGLLLAASPGGWAGQWYALLVGADDYQDKSLGEIGGAVNDAKLLQHALSARRVKVKLLLNQQVTYTAIARWWQQTIAKLKPGDTLLFAFAGHGAQESEAYPGSEAANTLAQLPDSETDTLDEVLVLPQYLDNDPLHSRERLVDNQLLGWAKAATDKGATVLIIADACYGGGMARSTSSGKFYGDLLAGVRNSNGKRLNPYDKSVSGTEAEAYLYAADSTAFQHRLFYAVPHMAEKKVVSEKVLDNKTHGLLSYLMAQVLSGSARDRQGKVVQDAGAINQYLRDRSKAASENEQIAYLIGSENNHTVLVPPKTGAGQQRPAAPKKRANSGFSVYLAPGQGRLKAEAGLYYPVAQKEKAQFRWQKNTGTIIQSGVGVVAYDINRESKLHAFFRQRQILAEIAALPLPHFEGIVVPVGQQDLRRAGPPVFEMGEQVAVWLQVPKFPLLFALNLPADGGVQKVAVENISALRYQDGAAQAGFNLLLGKPGIQAPLGSDHLLLLGLSRQSAEKIAFFNELQRHNALPNVSNPAEALLSALHQLKKNQATLAIVPFNTVQATGGGQ